MDFTMKEKGQKKKGLIFRTWRRCRSLGSIHGRRMIGKSLGLAASGRVAPEGCFWVRVGEEKQKFCIRTECLNHPLFKLLLEEAESEYGFTIDGPLELPCEVDLFIKVLLQMDSSWDAEDQYDNTNGLRRPPYRCITFSRSKSSNDLTSYHLLPSPRLMLPVNKVY